MLAGRDITYETAIPTHSLRLEADVVESIVAHSALAERELKSPLAERASEKPLERGGERERERDGSESESSGGTSSERREGDCDRDRYQNSSREGNDRG